VGETTISLRDEAYDRLVEVKREGESFSDVVVRLTTSSTREGVVDLAGGLGTETAEAVAASSAEVRESLEMDTGE